MGLERVGKHLRVSMPCSFTPLCDIISRMGRPWLFDLGAFLYGVMTAQATWRSSCARLANYFPAPATRVLDLGCGPGVSTIILAQTSNANMLVGLDLAPRMLAEAQHYTTHAHLDGRVRY